MPCTKLVTSHYMNQWWPEFSHHIVSSGLIAGPVNQGDSPPVIPRELLKKTNLRLNICWSTKVLDYLDKYQVLWTSSKSTKYSIFYIKYQVQVLYLTPTLQGSTQIMINSNIDLPLIPSTSLAALTICGSNFLRVATVVFSDATSSRTSRVRGGISSVDSAINETRGNHMIMSYTCIQQNNMSNKTWQIGISGWGYA